MKPSRPLLCKLDQIIALTPLHVYGRTKWALSVFCKNIIAHTHTERKSERTAIIYCYACILWCAFTEASLKKQPTRRRFLSTLGGALLWRLLMYFYLGPRMTPSLSTSASSNAPPRENDYYIFWAHQPPRRQPGSKRNEPINLNIHHYRHVLWILITLLCEISGRARQLTPLWCDFKKFVLIWHHVPRRHYIAPRNCRVKPKLKTLITAFESLMYVFNGQVGRITMAFQCSAHEEGGRVCFGSNWTDLWKPRCDLLPLNRSTLGEICS